MLRFAANMTLRTAIKRLNEPTWGFTDVMESPIDETNYSLGHTLGKLAKEIHDKSDEKYKNSDAYSAAMRDLLEDRLVFHIVDVTGGHQSHGSVGIESPGQGLGELWRLQYFGRVAVGVAALAQPTEEIAQGALLARQARGAQAAAG